MSSGFQSSFARLATERRREIADSGTGLRSEDHIDSGKKKFSLRAGKLTYPFRKEIAVKREDLRRVGDGILRQSGYVRHQQHVSRRVGPLKITG